MVKLVPAICPQCGAQLKVNPGDEQMDCEFCGTTIMIDDAVQKYKIEVEHKIRIDGLHGREYQFEQAQKHFDVGEYYEAISFLVSILTDDKFDIEALILFVKCNVTLLKEHNYKVYMTINNPNYTDGDEECFHDTLELVNRLEKVDKEKSYEKDLKDYLPILDELKKQEEELQEHKKRNKEYIERINKDMELASYYELDDKYFELLSDSFKVAGLLDILRSPDTGEKLFLIEFTELSTDGYLIGNYSLESTPRVAELNTLDLDDVPSSPDEVDKRFNVYKEKADALLDNAIEKENKELLKVYKGKKAKMIVGIIFVLITIAFSGFIVYVFAKDPDWPEVWAYIVIGMMFADFALIPLSLTKFRKWIVEGIKAKKDE